jgi:predicted metalloprotease with PDZ domain
MEKIEKYQNLIAHLLEEQAAPYKKMAKGEVQEQVIIDRQHHHFQWLTIGWDNKDNFEKCINIHFTIKPNGKIWLMENNTDIRIAEELVKLGVPREDIVLGFQPPSVRSSTDYAVA